VRGADFFNGSEAWKIFQAALFKSCGEFGYLDRLFEVCTR